MIVSNFMLSSFNVLILNLLFTAYSKMKFRHPISYLISIKDSFEITKAYGLFPEIVATSKKILPCDNCQLTHINHVGKSFLRK